MTSYEGISALIQRYIPSITCVVEFNAIEIGHTVLSVTSWNEGIR
eukprot:CAMPEP_0185778324 /NCGR_PEP_ID=MMETSP1174-20130828/92162_1 /TAXON_ID=35687 /ORGANISM="Dictyocha speculum, Strain CCMP1381" /LENGTH=44 /DNA_ID= /DNA_START= /DNA_END= /DNA_ORIENTATION=